MNIVKKYECLQCKIIVENDGKCKCESVVVVEGNLVKGTIGVNVVDRSSKLLNE